MDLKSLPRAIETIAEEKGIDKEKVLEVVESSIAAAYKKEYDKKGEIVKAKMDLKTGEVKFTQVKVVFDGNELINSLSEFPPDLIILDLIMPNKDGFSTLRELRSDDSPFKNTPILVSSNLGQSEDIVKVTKLGATDYIVKTDLSMKNLAEKVKRLLTP